MPPINSQNALAIAKLFAQQAMAVQMFRLDNFDALSDIQQSSCRSTEQHLRDTSNAFLALATTVILDDVTGSVTQLTNISAKLTSNLQKLTEINRGLAVIGIALQLAAGFASENPGAITSALSSAANALAPATDGAPDGSA